MRYLVLASALCLLLGARAAHGQGWPEPAGCRESANTERLRLTLPLDVLDHLDRMQGSVFVHAFLIRHVADPDAGNHRLSACARRFLAAGASDLLGLRANLPDAGALLSAIRAAEEARLRSARLADSLPTLGTVAARLRADTSAGALDAYGRLLASAGRACGSDRTAGPCTELRGASAALDRLLFSRSALEAAGERSRQAAEAAERATANVEASAAERERDSLNLERVDAGGTDADSATLGDLRLKLRDWDPLDQAVQQAGRNAAEAAQAADSSRIRAVVAADSARGLLLEALSVLEKELAERPLTNRTITAAEGSRIASSLIPLSAPPVQASDGISAARSPNLMLELTDFIIARARSEVVNSFVVNLHGLVREQPLMRYGFPDTWGLMTGITTRDDGRLNAVEVGRIPLNTWRATLAGDFVMLPVNLLESGAASICGVARVRVPTDSVARQAADSVRRECDARVAVLTPLGPMARRLLEGDAVFDVLRDVASLTPPMAPDLTQEWRRVAQGLTVVSAMAEVYLSQGHIPAADPVRHPYVLTGRSFAQVPKRQRDALVRLLVVRAVPTPKDAPSTSLDDTDLQIALQNAAAGLTRVLDRIASRPGDGDLNSTQAALLVRGGFDALAGSVDFAHAFAGGGGGGGGAARLDTIRTRWRAVSAAIEPIVARDFGLALSRTTVLLRELRGAEVPAPMFTLVALASSLSEARDGEQVRRAFEAAASPVGGWQGKRYGESGGSIAAFPGIAFGFEHVLAKDGDPPGTGARASTLGASLPIGVEWQFRLKGAAGISAPKCFLKVCGVGVFVPLVDLGAMLSYRLDGSEHVDSEPNATVRQVFAPGGYLSLALTRAVPLNLLAGAQLLPSLRRVDGSAGVENRSAWRWGVGLGMDVLLLGF